jgi:GH18 family chitinase
MVNCESNTDLARQHVVIPSADLTQSITHVILAFLRSDVFLADDIPDEYPLFTTITDVRSKFKPTTKVTVAIGGWGDYEGFEAASRDDNSRREWAAQVAHMVDVTGADGVDIDWEYPG